MSAPTTAATPGSPSPGKRAVLILMLLGGALVAALLIGEIFLRLVPIPGISFHAFYYDSVTGGRNYPNATLMYRNARGEEVRRRTNSWGFPDVEHELERVPNTLRIGFFGDSYAEAMQVQLEDTYFRVVDRELNARIDELQGAANRHGEPIHRVEAICFGMSGRSTLQSWLECGQWMDRTDLDYVVYLFVENDPIDHVRVLKGSDIVPYPILSADTFTVDRSFHERYGYKDKWPHRAVQYLKANSLVVSTIEGRLKLLKEYGIKRKVTEAERTGAVGAGGRVGMAPSTWPDSLVAPGWELTERVLERWVRDVEKSGRQFVVIRVPREEVLLVPLAGQDSWSPRLHAYCARAGVALIDPTLYLAERQRAGHEVYYDHFTPQGHHAFAEAFVSFVMAAECDHHSREEAP
ncbi:MAG TPA: hypothetical protein VFT13_02490 [Candidatus Krumholzibacteria bacterium]|nr:hypothetical protein [Candidatus Krumholzibacteria bacterium]